jgi:hypothetical protein
MTAWAHHAIAGALAILTRILPPRHEPMEAPGPQPELLGLKLDAFGGIW